jgi:hypothetical protein
MTLLICRTCPRYDRRATGQFARDLTAALRADGRDIPARNVQCLGGCPGDWLIPAELTSRISSVTAKRQADAPGQTSQPPQASHPASPAYRHRPWGPRTIRAS